MISDLLYLWETLIICWNIPITTLDQSIFNTETKKKRKNEKEGRKEKYFSFLSSFFFFSFFLSSDFFQKSTKKYSEIFFKKVLKNTLIQGNLLLDAMLLPLDREFIVTI